MTHVRFPRWIVAFVILSLAFAEAASAEPLVVTSGGWSADYGDPPGPIVLSGDRFTLRFFSLGSNGFVGPFSCPSPCAPGSPLDLSMHLGGPFGSTQSLIPPSAGPSQINGVTYSNLFLDGSLHWNAPTVPAAGGWVRAPFSFSGMLTAFTDSARTGPPVFASELIGVGQAGALFGGAGGLLAVEWSFQSAATSTPEPASLLLLGTGIVLTGLKARRRSSVTRRSSARDRDAE